MRLERQRPDYDKELLNLIRSHKRVLSREVIYFNLHLCLAIVTKNSFDRGKRGSWETSEEKSIAIWARDEDTMD